MIVGNLRQVNGVSKSVGRFFFATLLAASLAVGTSPAAKVIRGRVVAVQGGRTVPLAKALVNVQQQDGREVLTATRSASDGTFELLGPFSGNVTVRASKTGYDALIRSSRDGAAVLDCTAECGPVELTLSPGAVVAGVVTDDLGEPVPGVQVTLTDERNRRSRRGRGRGGEQTDDRGVFRISGIVPGVHELRAAAPFRGPADVRYEIDPVTVELEPGQELQVRLTVRRVEYESYRVSGVVTGVELDPENGGRLIARMAGGPARNFRRSAQATAVDPQGRFVFDQLAPGDYTFAFAPGSRRGPARGRRRSGAELGRASISGETTGLALAPVPRAYVAGRMEWDGEPDSRGTLYLRSLDGRGNVMLTASLPDFEFRADASPGRYRLQSRSRDAFVLSASISGREFDSAEFEIPESGLDGLTVVLSREFATVEGVVRAPAGEQAERAHYQVELRGPGPPRTTETDQYGRFRFDGLTPGDYQVGAWTGAPPDQENWRPFPVEAGARIELAITAEIGR